jgi:hypothetical protein
VTPQPEVRPQTGTGWLPVIVMAMIGLVLAIFTLTSGTQSSDTFLYSRAALSPGEYLGIWGTNDQSWFVYPPPLLQVFRALLLVGYPVAVLIWLTGSGFAMGLGARWYAVAAMAIGAIAIGLHLWTLAQPFYQLLIGNVQVWILAAVVLGLRYPALWAIPLLTKIGPGIGILWFVFRGEWRNLGIALLATGLIAGASFVVDPGLWSRWLEFSVANVGTPSPLPMIGYAPLRFALAVVLIAWGARTGRPWTVPIACGIASFALYEWSFLTIWLGAPILRNRLADDRGSDAVLDRARRLARGVVVARGVGATGGPVDVRA